MSRVVDAMRRPTLTTAVANATCELTPNLQASFRLEWQPRILEATTCLLAFYVSAQNAHAYEFHKIIQNQQWQAARFIVLLSLGITSFTLVAWLFSRLVFPLFVTRFFTP